MSIYDHRSIRVVEILIIASIRDKKKRKGPVPREIQTIVICWFVIRAFKNQNTAFGVYVVV